MDAIWTWLDPVIAHLGTLDLGEPEASGRALTERFGDLAELRTFCLAHAESLTPRVAGTARFGRLAKDRDGFSVDVVISSGRGMKHTHPDGEVNFCFAVEGDPTFDGDGPGWIVYGPGTAHPADVEGGTMFMIYFLPGGRIEWHREN